MNKINKILAVLFFIYSITVFGQDDNSKIETPYIEVTGTAEIIMVPDEIYIGIVIREKYENKIKVTVEEQDKKLLEALKSININLSDLYLSDANTDFVRVSRKKRNLLTKKEYILKVTDAPTVGLVFQELDKLEIKNAFISKTHHTKMDSLRKEVKILAIKAAKQKADYLLNAIGEETGKPLYIKEYETRDITSIKASGYKYDEGESSNSSHSYDNKTKADGVIIKGTEEDYNDVEFSKIKIQASVFVKFSIK